MSENEHRCRVCDGPLESPVQIVCNECNRRDTEEMEREMEFNDRSMECEEIEEVTENERNL
jgi:hypothetical protein